MKEIYIKSIVIASNVIFNFHSLQIHFYLSKRWLSCYNRSSPLDGFHIVLTLRGNNLKIYHNKVLQSGSRQNWDGFDADGPSDTVIGSYFADEPQFFSSIIMDELAMWNRVLSEAEEALVYDISFQ